MFGLGPWELIVILVIFVLLFGVGKLPELGSGLGKAIVNFKQSMKDGASIDVESKKKSEKLEEKNEEL